MAFEKRDCLACNGTGKVAWGGVCPSCKGNGYTNVPVRARMPKVEQRAPETLLERTRAVIEELARDSWKEGTEPYWKIRADAEKILSELENIPESAWDPTPTPPPIVYRRRGDPPHVKPT